MENLLVFPRDEYPTAIFIMNDLMVLSNSNSKRKGLSLPEDISIVGLDNIPLSEVFSPP